MGVLADIWDAVPELWGGDFWRRLFTKPLEAPLRDPALALGSGLAAGAVVASVALAPAALAGAGGLVLSAGQAIVAGGLKLAAPVVGAWEAWELWDIGQEAARSYIRRQEGRPYERPAPSLEGTVSSARGLVAVPSAFPVGDWAGLFNGQTVILQ